MYVGVVVNALVKTVVSEVTRDAYRGVKHLIAEKRKNSKGL